MIKKLEGIIKKTKGSQVNNTFWGKAKVNEKMVITLKNQTVCGSDDSYPIKIDLYLTDINQINGAGWNHGKLGRGNTIVIK